MFVHNSSKLARDRTALCEFLNDNLSTVRLNAPQASGFSSHNSRFTDGERVCVLVGLTSLVNCDVRSCLAWRAVRGRAQATSTSSSQPCLLHDRTHHSEFNEILINYGLEASADRSVDVRDYVYRLPRLPDDDAVRPLIHSLPVLSTHSTPTKRKRAHTYTATQAINIKRSRQYEN